jgi:hypothetical protein
MTTTLVNTFNTDHDVCFAKTPAGEVFMVNGIDRGRKWTGTGSSTVVLGLDAPVSAPVVVESAGGGGSETGTYLVAYRFGDADGNYSSLSPTATVTTTADDATFVWDPYEVAANVDSGSRITKRQLFRTTVGQADVFYLVTEITNNTATTYSDTLSDEDLSDNEELPILNDDDSLNANRFGVPPKNKAVAIWHQDRMFYFADAPVTAGTVTVTNASASVTGTGTNFNRYLVGRKIYIAGDSVAYDISAFASATSISLSAGHVGNLAGAAYAILTDPAERNVIYYSEAEEPESVPVSQNNFLLQENNGEEDDLVGGYSVGQTLYLCQRNHTYAFTYVVQPHLDGSARLAFRRGLLNHNCRARGDDGIEFCLDSLGPYAARGGSIQPIGEPVKNYFRDGLVDLAYARRFHVGVNQRLQCAYFYIRLTTDTAVRRALVYNYALNSWSEELYPWAVGAAVELENTSGTTNYLVGKTNDRFCKATHGVSSDGITTPVSGAVSTIVGTTLTATSGIFTTGHVDCPIVLTSGHAKGLQATITARASATEVTLDATPSGMAAGDTFKIGAIAWKAKTGMLDFPRNALENNERAIEVLFKPTTATGNSLDIRHYLGYSATPENSTIEMPEMDAGARLEYGSPDGVVTLDFAGALSDSTGFARKLFSGRNAHGLSADRNVSVELRGVAAGEPIEINQINVVGAK